MAARAGRDRRVRRNTRAGSISEAGQHMCCALAEGRGRPPGGQTLGHIPGTEGTTLQRVLAAWQAGARARECAGAATYGGVRVLA